MFVLTTQIYDYPGGRFNRSQNPGSLSPMTAKSIDELTKRAHHLGFRQGYEIANRNKTNESISKETFVDRVLEAVLNSLESTVFKSISNELDLMNEKYPAFDSWKVFVDAVIQGAGENYADRTGDGE
jgi:hypothetical protein